MSTKQTLRLKIINAPIHPFSKHASFINYRLSMDTKNPINLTPQNKSCIHVIVDAFNLFVVTVPIESNNAKTAVTTLLHHWIAKYGPSVYLVTDRGFIMIWQIYVLSWVVDILLEHLTPLD